ncbi:amidohydrolase family protein [Candidatus Poriferisocius sp.]|uniref:amidohydrolase family protein n=1 Tax=Candidatus Poriferisocius sp. TaxID=3101276 RepID=UPI003B015A02
MSSQLPTASSKVREQLDHPVIDGDGHWVEPYAIFLDFLKSVADPKVYEPFSSAYSNGRSLGGEWYDMTPQERLDKRAVRYSWWRVPMTTLDMATSMAPQLMYERLDEIGTDYCITYPSLGLMFLNYPNEEIRRATCRASNEMNAEMFRPFADRMTPVAVVPCFTPDEAIEEAEYCVRKLGMKVILTSSYIQRPVEAYARPDRPMHHSPTYIDSLALDSPYDYDPFWAKCVELNVPVTVHAASQGWGHRTSTSNFCYNHIGHFANANQTLAKALVIGGVTRRFPTLPFAFLEGGVGWACSLLPDLVEHWEKRNTQALEAHVRPSNVDIDRLTELLTQYGDERLRSKIDAEHGAANLAFPFESQQEATDREYREPTLDDFAAAEVTSADELKKLFTENFYFGCEAGDVTVPWAFDKHDNHRLKALYSSDVGHFDVPDMREVLAEAWELVDDGLIDEDNFREFTFENSARLHTQLNPSFFEGTVIEDDVARLLANEDG